MNDSFEMISEAFPGLRTAGVDASNVSILGSVKLRSTGAANCFQLARYAMPLKCLAAVCPIPPLRMGCHNIAMVSSLSWSRPC